MLSDLGLYLSVIGSKWWTVVTAVLFGGIPEVVGVLSPATKAWIDRRISPGSRRLIFLLLMVVALAYVGFAAFEEEHRARLSADEQVQSGREVIAKLQGQLSASPPGRLQTIIREVPAKERQPLSRDLKLKQVNIIFAGLTADGAQAATMAEVAKSPVRGLVLTFNNIGTATIRWKLLSAKIIFPNGAQVSTKETGVGFSPAGDISNLQLDLKSQVEIPRSTSSLNMPVVFEYDTVPSTGMRTSRILMTVGIGWIAPQPNNNTVDVPVAGGFTVSSDKES